MGAMRIKTGHQGRNFADGFHSAEWIGKGVGVSSGDSMLDFRGGDLAKEGSDGCQ